MKKLTPAKALDIAISSAFLSSRIRSGPHGRPGEVIELLPKDVREVLKDLKAEDTQVRVDGLVS
jgi:hypothetical protein